MKVGNLVRRKPNPITNQPEILGLVTEILPDPVDATIRVTFIDADGEAPHHAQYWRSASHYEVVS
jgi:hypothetical protein